MREDMKSFLILVPVASIEVISVLWKTCKVYYSEKRRVARPVCIIRCRLSEIVKSCPYELTDAVWKILVLDEVILRKV